MCTYLIQIAEGQNDRAIFRCEHGTFHLAWDRGLLYVSPEELPYLHALFTKAKISSEAHVEHEHIQLSNHTASDGYIYFELWINDAGLRLSLEDCQTLKGLLANALDWQKKQSDLTSQEHIRIAKALADMDLKTSTNTNRKSYWN